MERDNIKLEEGETLVHARDGRRMWCERLRAHSACQRHARIVTVAQGSVSWRGQLPNKAHQQSKNRGLGLQRGSGAGGRGGSNWSATETENENFK